MAKKVVREIMHDLDVEHKVASKEDIVRPLFDFLYDKKDEELMENEFNNDMLRSLDDGKNRNCWV